MLRWWWWLLILDRMRRRRCGSWLWCHLLRLTLSSHHRIYLGHIDHALLLWGRWRLLNRLLLDGLPLLYWLRSWRSRLYGLWSWCPMELLRRWLRAGGAVLSRWLLHWGMVLRRRWRMLLL